MNEQAPIVLVLDDDASFRRSCERLLKSAGFEVRTFSSAETFLASDRPAGPACVLLDMQMPRMSGLEVQRSLLQTGSHLPVVFVSGHSDIPISVRAMKHGAVEFLTKPVRESVLLEAIEQAIARDRASRLQHLRLTDLDARNRSLSKREREVMSLIVKGLLNKQTGSELGITEATVKVHRRHLMRKMCARSLPALVLMTEQLRRADML